MYNRMSRTYSLAPGWWPPSFSCSRRLESKGYLSQPPHRMLVIACPKSTGGGEHWGVLFPGNLVAHNTPERGEHISTLSEFAPNGIFRIVREVPHERFHASLRRIQAAVQSPTAPTA